MFVTTSQTTKWINYVTHEKRNHHNASVSNRIFLSHEGIIKLVSAMPNQAICKRFKKCPIRRG